MSTVLVLNMGMKSIRSIVFNNKGEKLSSYSLPLQTTLMNDKVTQEAEEWWNKAKVVIKECLSRIQGINIDFITVTTSASCLICVDEGGESLYPSIMVSDKRANQESNYLAGLPEFISVKDKTGLEMDASLMLPKILWLKNHEPNIFKTTYKFLSPNDYLVMKLSGRYITDYMNAQKYHYDISNKKYPKDILNIIGITEEKLPEVVEPGTFVENILISVGAEIGIGLNCKVVLSTYDAICSFMGSGVMEEGEASDVSGTVTVFRAITYRKDKLFSNKISCIPYQDQKIQIIGGSNNLGGGLIEWVKQCYYQSEIYPYELMEKDAKEVECGARGVIFLPYLLGERAPLWNNEARGVFFGLERMHTRKEMTRAVFESTGFIDFDLMQSIEDTGIQIPQIRLSGGLARINLISQIKADITGKEIIVLSDFETTSIGSAMIVLTSMGDLSSWEEAVTAFVKVRMIIKPDFTNHKLYQHTYQLFKETYHTLEPLFVKRMQMIESIYGNRLTRIENL